MGNVGITLSTSDSAGSNVLSSLIEMGFEETDRRSILQLGEIYLIIVKPLIVPEERYTKPAEPEPYPIDYDKLAIKYDLDYIVVASKHWARSGKPSFTVHPPGNFGKAVYGGNTRELQRTLANPMRNVFIELLRDTPKGFEVSLEATHHSPTQFLVPMFFAELGSSEIHWMDKPPGQHLSEAIIRGIKSKDKVSAAIGFGGGHYCPTFTVLEKEVAFGHIAAKHSLDLLNYDLARQMVERTLDGVDKAVLDKGLKGFHRKKIEVLLKKLNVEIEAR